MYNLLSNLYKTRFPDSCRDRRNEVWKVLCRNWFSRYISPEARLLEIGAGYCEFINNIEAAEKTAVDLNPDMVEAADAGIKTFIHSAENLPEIIAENSIDVVFMSNFLEHCETGRQMMKVLRNTFDVLTENGILLVLGPNFRYCIKDYYDYFDHHLPLTDRSLSEALEVAGFKVICQLPKTLPFSFKSKLPTHPTLVKLYLKLPFLWYFFGAQFFLVAQKDSSPRNE